MHAKVFVQVHIMVLVELRHGQVVGENGMPGLHCRKNGPA